MVTATMKELPGYFSKRKSLRVRLDSLVVHPVAQRTLIPSWVKFLEENMNINLIGVISVVEYAIGGRTGIWIVDGQHRYQALMSYGCGDLMVEVHLYIDVQNEVDSCLLFRYLNKRKTVGPWDDYHKALLSKDTLAVGMTECVESNGLKVAQSAADNTLNCIAALKRIYSVDNGESLDKTLKVCKEAWGTKSSVLEGKLIEGVGKVFGKYNGKIDIPALVKKLQKRKAASIIGAGSTLMEVRKHNLTRCIGDIVIEEYNAGRRVGRLDPL